MSSLQLSDKTDTPFSLAGALVSGLIFGLGLLLAGMTNPAKVLGFLDIAGAWDPSLALVMVGGIAVARIGLLVVRRRGATLTGLPLHMPHERTVEHRLLIGSALFGLGWGLAGFCPGPAVAAVGFDYLPAFPVVAGMLAGLWMRPLPRIH
jgi:uncharacterized protein